MCKFEEINKRYNTEYTNRLYKNKNIFYELKEKTNDKYLCGSYLIDGTCYEYSDKMYEKQELLYNSVKNEETVLEIGSYMGHSLLIMLLSNPNLKITCVDIDDNYTKPCTDILNKYFNNQITFIHGNSINVIEELINKKEKFDFFHIDASHENSIVTKEFNGVLQLNKNIHYMKVIFDDWLCMEKLSKEILKKYKIINDVIPVCGWSNRLLIINLI